MTCRLRKGGKSWNYCPHMAYDLHSFGSGKFFLQFLLLDRLDPCNRSTGLFSCYIRGVFAFEIASVYNSTYLNLTASFSIYIKTKIKINN